MKKEKKELKSTPVKIGLEIHGYLNTEEKLFCKCSTSLEDLEEQETPNSRICPICTGQPGSKPMLPNSEALKKVIQIGLLLDCKLNHDKKLVWQRKHYSWPDLPKGYQNTVSGAYSIPVAENGKFQGIRIREAHIEEDPAQWNPDTGKINYNRSGLPLIEIVTEPDFAFVEEVIDWLKNLVIALSYIKAIRKNAGIKVDVNISTYGDRAEIKNLNSLVKIKSAIGYEIARQLENYEQGIIQKRETLAYDEKKGKTIKMRDKEGQADYRFVPDPDLPVLDIDIKMVDAVKKNLPESPQEKLEKLLKKYKLDEKNAMILTKNLELVDFFEALSDAGIDVKDNISWVTIELLRVLNYNKKTLEDEDVDIKPEHLAELIKAVEKKQVTVLKAKQIMNDFVPKSFSINEKSHKKIGIISEKEIEEFCNQVLKKNPSAVQDFKAGKKESLNFLVGQVMSLSNRRADFNIARVYLEKLLK